MHPNKKVFVTFLSFVLAMVVIACLCSPTPVPPTVTSTPPNPMPGLAGTWNSPDTGDVYEIAWQGGQYVVVSCIWEGTSYDITSQSWNGSSLIWSYNDSDMGQTVTLTTTSLSGDSLDVDWSLSDGSSGTTTLQRGGVSPVTPFMDVTATPESVTPETQPTVSTLGLGDLQVTLNWNSSNAVLYLYVIDPEGNNNSYYGPPSPGGPSLYQSHYCADWEFGKPDYLFWTTPPNGTYQVSVVYFFDCGGAGPVNFTVTVCKKGICTDPVGSTANAANDIVPVTNFEYP